jgi:subtilisin family serine protease
MKKPLLLSIVSIIGVTLVSILPQVASGQTAKFRRSDSGVSGRYIVVLNPKFVDKNAPEPTVASEAAHLRGIYGGEVREIYSNALKGFVVEMSERAAMALSKNERVSFVEQDAQTFGSATETSASWGLDRIDQRSLPLNSQYSWGTDASNVHAYILDSGIRPTHVDFGGRATADYDAVGDGQNGIDCSGHGTHVAGTVGSSTYGVAKNIRLHGVRVLPCSGSGQVSHLIMGLDWVSANRVLPAVANISITASGPSNAMDTAIQNTINSGVTVVVAAGNYNMDACNYSPARMPAAITVGATVSSDAKASYSNFGTCVDTWAPGTSITSVGHSSDTATRVMSGTSMASPHVTGVAALYLAANPNASPATVAASINSTSTSGIVTGLDTASPNRMVYSWLSGSAPAPSPARVTIKKRARTSGTESVPTTAFPYSADNLATTSFSLYPENQFVDPGVTEFGSGNMITVTENQVLGWNLTDISCVETSGSGLPNSINTTVDLANRKAYIVAEEGEQVECTFTSEPIAPSASYASISGRVLTADGRGVKGARVDLLNASTNEFRYVTTNTFGHFIISDLRVGDFYVISIPAVKKRGGRNQLSQAFTLEDDLTGMDFILPR